MSENNFKIGDMVKLKKNRLGFTPDRQYRVLDITNDILGVTDDDGCGRSIHKNSFQKVTEPKFTDAKFNVGDIVNTKWSAVDLTIISRRVSNGELIYKVKSVTGNLYEFMEFDFILKTNQESSQKADLEQKQGVKHMNSEDIKGFDKKNLKAGKQLSIKEQNDFETKKAQEYYTQLIDRKQEKLRTIEIAKEQLKVLEEKLALFKD